ncbi:hypothetical protein [Mesorhizobium sp.]|uniref:hypothetical protein n=1 Tax=Mesorhizobium sp. TaxID=1871066 RepID=UPI001222B67A|nr:hypothetical protein [Mesorhizobium sp.]TIX28897.1 MAG: hypothetical protein E5V35_00620 [Mesorhizobium sp.]
MIEELIERLERLEAPDRAVDFAIAFATQHRPTYPEANFSVAESFAEHEKKHDFATAWIAHRPWHDLFGVPAFTADLNAPVKLLERILPGFAWKVGTCCVSDDAWVVPDLNCPVHGERLLK